MTVQNTISSTQNIPPPTSRMQKYGTCIVESHIEKGLDAANQRRPFHPRSASLTLRTAHPERRAAIKVRGNFSFENSQHQIAERSNMASSAPQACCLTGTEHDGTPTGTTTTLAGHDVYRAGAGAASASRAAVLLFPDLLGWTYPNTRLLADALAAACDATVVVPDLFQGEELPREPIDAGRWDEVDVPGFLSRHGRAARWPAVRALARALRTEEAGGFERVGAVGFCYGAWAAMALGAEGEGLVDVVAIGHPSLLTAEDIRAVRKDLPVLVLAAERDPVFTAELKALCFSHWQEREVPFAYYHFPGVEHGCFLRGDPARKGEKEAMCKAKNAVIFWLQNWLTVRVE
jgi:dienelactone hydrolase